MGSRKFESVGVTTSVEREQATAHAAPNKTSQLLVRCCIGGLIRGSCAFSMI